MCARYAACIQRAMPLIKMRLTHWEKRSWLPVVDSNHDSRIQRPLSYAKFGTAAYRGMIPLSSSITIRWFAGMLPKCWRGPLGHSTSTEDTAVSAPRPNVSANSLCEQ